MISWILAFVIGRVISQITWKPIALVVVLALGVTFLFRGMGTGNFWLDALANLIGFAVLFALGHIFGRWWDGRKDVDGFAD